MKKITALSMFLLVACAALAPSAGAVVPSRKHDPQSGSVWENHTMKDPIDLANIPRYSGKAKFMCGTMLPHARSGVTYTQRFVAEEDQISVLNWYRQVLTSPGWSLDPVGSRGTTLAAIDKDGNICQFTIFSSYPQGKHYRTEFLILFKSAK
jgi:hypothetical protein